MSEQPTEIMPSVSGEGERPRRRRVVPLVVGLILVIGAAGVGGFFLLRASMQDAAAPVISGTATSSPSHTPTPAPASPAVSPGASGALPSGSQAAPPPASASAPAPAIESFSVGPQTVTCSAPAPGLPGLTSTPLTISWSIVGGLRAWVGVDTDDAMAEPYAEVSAEAGSTTDLQYLCADDHRYTLTVLGADGQTVSRTVTVTNIGDR